MLSGAYDFPDGLEGVRFSGWYQGHTIFRVLLRVYDFPDGVEGYVFLGRAYNFVGVIKVVQLYSRCLGE